MMDDAALLRAYAENRSETAFAEFVGRRVGFVYAAALRMVAGDAHTAQDVTQAVFVLVANKAAALATHQRLAGWLHDATRNVSRQTLRAARRRAAREQEAARMNEIENENNNRGTCDDVAASERRFSTAARGEASQNSNLENQIGALRASGGCNPPLLPMLDEALGALREVEREAVLLRYFEGLAFAAIGAKLSMPEDAARMRVTRAVEKMRAAFARRGVTSSAAALGALMAAEAAQAAPAGLAASVSAGALAAAGAAAAGAATATATIAGAFLAFVRSAKITTAAVVALLLVAGGAYYGVQNAQSERATGRATSSPSAPSHASRDQRSNDRQSRQPRTSFLVDLSALSFPDPAAPASLLTTSDAMQTTGSSPPPVPGLSSLAPLPLSAFSLSPVLPFHAQTQPAFEPSLSFDGSGITGMAAQLQQQFKTAQRPAQQQQVKAATRPASDKWARTLLPVGLHPNPQADYAIVTELTKAGRKLPKPAFDKPVYYIAHSMGEQDIGDAYGLTKDIPYNYLRERLNESLASNGYRPYDPAQPGHAPTLVLFFAWGMHNAVETPPPPVEGKNNSGWLTEKNLNLLSRAKTVGGQKFADEYAAALQASRLDKSDFALRSFANRDETTETLVYAVSNECYYLIVTAYDLKALANNQRNPLPLLWVTRISTVSRGISFERTLPIMVNNAAYFFGRETPPEILRKRAYKNPTVEIGDPTVVEYMTPPAAVPSEARSSTIPNPEIPNPK